ncbi:hypothetical protein EU91_0453 [Prochlorococcus marinus str. GP2]|uniref:Uncharacterized protein n=1 Tax=Prochlorococcus marinus str. GP2 TaxID=59925 RepID=A0A0A1ZGI3_PROMR|nr:hypothetical protein EU91_0453 [Prochlorococcus marinus str. GP2]
MFFYLYGYGLDLILFTMRIPSFTLNRKYQEIDCEINS